MKGLDRHQTSVIALLVDHKAETEAELHATPSEDVDQRRYLQSRIRTFKVAIDALKLRWGVRTKKLSKAQTEALRLVALRGHVPMGFKPLTKPTATALAKLGLVDLVPDDDHYQDIYVILTDAGKVEVGAWATTRMETVHRTQKVKSRL